MAVKLGDAMVVVKVDTSRLKPSLDTAKRETQKATQQMEGNFNSAGASVGNLGKKILAVAAAYIGFRTMTNGVVAFTKAANDAAETQNKFEVAFRGMRHEATAAFEAFSEAAGGLNVTALKDYSSAFKLLFNAMGTGEQEAANMSVALTKLSYDLASIYNTNIEEAFTRLQSGLVGETEAVRRFGVDVSEAALKQELLRRGSDKSYESLSQGEKVLLRYGMIMRQTNDAQGDLINTQNSGANVMRRFSERWNAVKIDLGQGFRKLIEIFGPKLLDVLNKIDFKKITAQIMAGAEQLYRSWKPAIDAARESIKYMIEAIKEVGPAVAKIAASNGFALMLAGIIGITRAVGGLLNLFKTLGIAWANTMTFMVSSAKKVAEALNFNGVNNGMILFFEKTLMLLGEFKKSFNPIDMSGVKKWQDAFKDVESTMADKPPAAVAEVNSALDDQVQKIMDIYKANKEAAKATMERMRANIGFSGGREQWEKGAVAGEQWRYSAEPSKLAADNLGSSVGFSKQGFKQAYDQYNNEMAANNAFMTAAIEYFKQMVHGIDVVAKNTKNPAMGGGI